MGLVDKTIRINNVKPDYIVEHISIHQSYYNHHFFTINLIIPQKEKFGIDELKKYLGETIEITFNSSKDKSIKNKFIGLIHKASPCFMNGQRMLRMEGYSPSILLDGSPHFRVFSEKSVKDIAQPILRRYSTQKSIDANLEVPFIVQCQESDYRFLCRLANANGLVFYYDGEKILLQEFGSNSEQAEIDLQTKDIQSLEASVNLCQLDFEVLGYDYQKDAIQKARSPKRYASNEPLVKATIDKSNIYPTANVSINYLLDQNQTLEKIEQQFATQQTNNLVTIHCSSDKFNLKIGTKVKIHQKKDNLLPGIDRNTAFIITKISHSLSDDGNYQNSFTAIPADHPFPLNLPNTQTPVCGPLTAIVKETEDPDNLGRIRVQFVMDENESISPWIRVLTSRTSYGGALWSPEKEEKVVAFFEEFNCEKSPFIIGSFYTGGQNAEAWKTDEKGILMENIAMIFNDKEGLFTLKAKTVKIEAEELIELSNTKQIKLDASNNISNITKEMAIEADQKISAEAKEIAIEASLNMELGGGQQLKQTATIIKLN